AGDVTDHLALVGQADLGHLAQGRVRLLRGRRIDAGANAALLRVRLHRRDLVLGLLRFATLADQLVNRRHEALHLSLPEAPAVTLPNAKGAKPGRPSAASHALDRAMFSSCPAIRESLSLGRAGT